MELDAGEANLAPESSRFLVAAVRFRFPFIKTDVSNNSFIDQQCFKEYILNQGLQEPEMTIYCKIKCASSETMRLNIGGSTFEDEGTLMKIS